MGRKGMKGFLKGVAHAPDGPDKEEAEQKAAAAAASSSDAPAPKAKSKAKKAAAFLVSPPTGAAEPPSDEEVDDGDSKQENRSQMLQRHKREVMAHKKAMSRMAKNKKDEVAKLTAEMEARHGQELVALEEAEAAASSGATAAADTAEKLADLSTSEDAGGKVRLTKAQKRRQKRAQEDAEREARIAEELAAAGPSAGQLEEKRLREMLAPKQLRIFEIRADGHCLYRAIEHQLQQQEPAATHPDYLRLRRLAAEHMRQHADDYAPFLAAEAAEEEEGQEEDLGKRLEAHCLRVEETAAWGGQTELRALAEALQQHIRVYAVGMPAVEMGEEHAAEDKPPLQVCYLRHAFGLGEHYNSLEPVGSDDEEDEEEEEEGHELSDG